eukprot:NODE_4_length_55019_cov_0.425091.p30 type:complete len:197 gc:universal NODE_4_length_55019_cov_0.425091:17772-17182(-)
MSVSVSPLQSGNNVLSHIIQVPYNIVDDIIVDFSPNEATGIFFLSVSYHRLHPEYIETRLKMYIPYKIKLILIKIDLGDYSSTLQDLYLLISKSSFNCLIGASDQECGLILENFCIYSKKPSNFLLSRKNNEYLMQVQNSLTAIKGVNKSDALTLITKFKSIKQFSKATKEELADCPGIADTKISRILNVLNSKLS